MDAKTKAEIKKVMLEYLQYMGWPNMPDPDRFVMDQAENMFKILLKRDLVKYTDWDSYYMAAISQYERAQLRKAGYDV